MRPLCLILFLLLARPPAPCQSVPEPGGTAKDLLETPLEDLLSRKVNSASLHDQTLEDAPADVTVITAEEIRERGCQTLAEALSFVRGAYLTYDYAYWSLGLRGFGVPGDYDVFVLIQINGHTILDNVDEMGAWYGLDFPLDMSLIQRIEVVRGSSSALYGSNGIFATINVVTKAPELFSGEEVRVETGTLGEKKTQVTMAAPIGKRGRLLFSASAFQQRGCARTLLAGIRPKRHELGQGRPHGWPERVPCVRRSELGKLGADCRGRRSREDSAGLLGRSHI